MITLIEILCQDRHTRGEIDCSTLFKNAAEYLTIA